MSFGNSAAIQADVLFRADYVQFEGDTAKIRESAQRTYGALDAGALKAALASEKYDRALARSKGSSYAVAKATAAYKAELGSIAAAEERATVGSTRHSGALASEERSLRGVARGALAGSGVLGHLGRAAIFASSSLLGGYGLIYALRSTIAAAREHEVAVGHAQVSLKNAGLSWQQYGADITAALDKQIKATGFADHELTESFARFVRRFGGVNQALRANAIAADVARARNIDLAAAADLVQRASFGNPRALRALDIQLTKTTSNVDALKATTGHATVAQIANAKAADQQATSMRALDVIASRYHGNSARFLQTDAGKQALFNAELTHSEEIIGTALLPTFNHYLESLSSWLEKMNSSGKLQRDVNDAMTAGKDAVQVLGGAVHFLDGVTGSFKNTLELLLALKLGLVFGGWAVKAMTFSRALRGVASAEKAVAEAGVAGEIAGIGGAAAAATPEVIGLRAALLSIASLGPIAGILAVSSIAKDAVTELRNNKKELAKEITLREGKNGVSVFGKDGHIYEQTIPFAGGQPVTVDITNTAEGRKYMQQYKRALANRLAIANATAADRQNPRRGVPGSGANDPVGSSGSRASGGTGGSAGPTIGLSYAEQNKLLEAEATSSTADDAAVLREQLAILNRQLGQKGLTAEQRNEILSARNDVQGQLRQIAQANASARSDAARKAAAARRKHFLALTQIPAQLVAREARLEAKDAPAAQIVKVLREEEAALRRQDAQLRREHAPEQFDAKIAHEEELLHRRVQEVLKNQRRKRIQALEDVPVDLRLAEATARAHNASEETILKILEKEKAALEQQVATLKKIGASKDEILKARKNEATVQAKINAVSKGSGPQGQAFIDSLSGVLGQFASDVGIASKSGATDAKVIHVHVDQRGQEQSAWAAARAAREAAMHLL